MALKAVSVVVALTMYLTPVAPVLAQDPVPPGWDRAAPAAGPSVSDPPWSGEPPIDDRLLEGADLGDAPLLGTLPDDRAVSLVYEHDWLANMTEWTDDASAFDERSIGAITNGFEGRSARARSTSRRIWSGELLEVATWYPNGAQETLRKQQDDAIQGVPWAGRGGGVVHRSFIARIGPRTRGCRGSTTFHSNVVPTPIVR